MVQRQPEIPCRHIRQGEYRVGSPAHGRADTAHTRHPCTDRQGRAQAQEERGTG